MFRFFLEWLMEADPPLPAWCGWSTPPPTAGGGRAAIQRWMNSVALRLAKQRRNTHVRMPMGSRELLWSTIIWLFWDSFGCRLDFDESIGGWTNVHVVLPQPQGWLYSSPTSVTRSRFGCQLRWVHFFWPSPFWPLDDFCWFFLLNLGLRPQITLGGPLWDQIRPHPIKKIGGNFYPNPPEPTGADIRTCSVLRS